MAELKVIKETYPLHSSFAISRSSKTAIDVVVVEINDGEYTGRGECRPYERYNQSSETVIGQIESVQPMVESNLSRLELMENLPAGAARNAIDCALWDLEAKQKKTSVWALIGGTSPLNPVSTVQSLSLGTPKTMSESAKYHADYKTLKIKLSGDEGDLDRLRAIYQARPDAKFVVDANEGWNFEQLKRFVDEAQSLNVFMIEQPLPHESDEELLGYDSGNIVLCGDESIHDISDLRKKSELYGMVNFKLDKSGGLTHALEMRVELEKINQQNKNIQLMIGCMVSTSLAIQPHILLAQDCDLADLDGPWWIKERRKNGVEYENGTIIPCSLWG